LLNLAKNKINLIMNKIYKNLLSVFAIMMLTFAAHAQKSYFSDISEFTAKAQGGTRVTIPNKYRTVALDKEAMRAFLWSLPSEANVQNRSTAPILALPMPDGSTARFHVWESSVQEKGLEEKFPEIKTFAGQGIDDRYATIRLDYNPYSGFHAQILSAVTGRIYIDPFAKNNTTSYISYNHTENRLNRRFNCIADNTPELQRPESVTAGPCRGTTLLTYRLAVACTGEYAQAVGGGLAGPTHAAIVTSVNRITGVYEVEVAIRMVLIANNNLIEYLDGTTDPYVNTINGTLLNANQTNIDAVIGSANYDIGHIFTSDDNGLAQLSSVCGSGKARGATGAPSLVGDGFDIDFVAHEMGHQFGGPHTFNTAGCFGGAGAGGSYEPGGGTTIMAYAGICAATENLQPNSDPIFHAKSFDDISNFVNAGGTCGVPTATGNILPVIAPLVNNNISIPINTPFVLNASATDANGDALTYNWEGWDIGPAGTWPSAATSTTRPLFRTRLSKTTGERTFPDIRVIAANYPGTTAPSVMNGLRGEVLPQVARAMKFRLTVRDNRAGGGGVVSAGEGCQDPTTFTVNAVGTTPFSVTIPNGGESYFAGSTQTITWNNAATNAAPFNVTNVRISFSNDGGLTYPTTILASTANDGTESVTMPATVTSTARIRVEAIGNIFFDISNANFSLTAPPTGYNFGAAPTTTSACPAAATMTATIATTAFGGFANPITLAATGNPAGTTVAFAPNPVTPGSSSVITLSGTNTLAAGTYVVNITGTATGTTVQNTTATFTITAGAGPTLTTQPANATVCAPNTATFTVATAATGVSYQWQFATAAAPTTFNNIGGVTTASYTLAATSSGVNGNIYRCIVSTQCGTTTSNTATLTVNTAAAITTQPANQPACTGQTATFTVAATGTGVTYQWQSATAAAGPFGNVTTGTGGTTASYTTETITATTPTFYRVIVTTTTCAGTVNSNSAQLTISTTTSTTNPTAQTVCAPATATFSVVGTGTGISNGPLQYQWQVALAATPTVFNNITGATTASFTTPATMATMNGNMYRVIVTGACNVATSTAAMLTVNTAAALTSVTVAPTNATVCNGETVAFTSVATGTGITYQWQVATATAPTVFNNIAGATNANFTTLPTTPAMNGNLYRLVVTSTLCPAVVTSTPIAITVNTVAVIGTQPTVQTACIPNAATFSVTATGTGLTYQWQVATAAAPTVFTNITGATSASYNTGTTSLAMNGNLYRVSILSTCSPTTPTVSNAVVLTVQNPVSITQQPTAKSGCALENYTFSVTASSPGNTITYQWQVSPTGLPGTFTNIPSTNSSSYTVSNAPIFLNGYFYRAYLSVPCGASTSVDTTAAAKLTLTYKPSIVLTQPQVSNQNAAVNSILSTTVSPGPANAYTYNWTRNGTVIPNTLATTRINLAVDDAASYQVSITDPVSGCVAQSNIIVTNALTSDNLQVGKVFIYPNPVSNIMTVRYNTSASATRGTSINVYDEKGSRIFSKAFGITGTNGRMDIDMSRFPMGTYLVYVMDANGKKLAGSKAVKVQ
jgi:hypothetical protein